MPGSSGVPVSATDRPRTGYGRFRSVQLGEVGGIGPVPPPMHRRGTEILHAHRSGYACDVHIVARRRRLAWAAVLVIGASSAACSTPDADDPQVRASAVYAEMLRWFADARSDDPEPLPVFVEPRGEGASIPLEVQAELVTEVEDVVDVRFIDTRDEAFVTDDDGTPVVADGGMLLRLAPVDEMADPVRVDVDVHLQDDEFMTMTFELSQVGDGWVVSGNPEQVSTPSAGGDD